MGRRGSFFGNFMAVFKVVVGQRDPFMHRVFKSASLRSVAVTFLYMATILNEGYKNENMYHNISPRKLITQVLGNDANRDQFHPVLFDEEMINNFRTTALVRRSKL